MLRYSHLLKLAQHISPSYLEMSERCVANVGVWRSEFRTVHRYAPTNSSIQWQNLVATGPLILKYWSPHTKIEAEMKHGVFFPQKSYQTLFSRKFRTELKIQWKIGKLSQLTSNSKYTFDWNWHFISRFIKAQNSKKFFWWEVSKW